MQDLMKALEKDFEQDLQQSHDQKHLQDLKVKYLGKKSPIQALMKELKHLTPEERPAFGKKINEMKQSFEEKIDLRIEQQIFKEEQERLSLETIDISEPARRQSMGRRHPSTQMLDRVLEVLKGMGFSIQYGPDIDTEYYNFEALNFEDNHPARDMQDTFYIEDDVLLRTHTSNVQVRVMEANKPPIRVAIPGKCYRNENISARSHVFFHQVEALYIDKSVTFSDLLDACNEFIFKLFEKESKTRFRPSYFPFVEPGLEIDMHCLVCNGKGCPICKYSGWLEIAGAGMVHPEVLKNGGIDPEEYNGYAWGFGIERLVMMKYGIKDIRSFTENDLRFLEQFPR